MMYDTPIFVDVCGQETYWKYGVMKVTQWVPNFAAPFLEVKNGELKLPLTIIKKSIVVLISDPHNGTIFSNRSRKFYHRIL